MIYTDIAPDAVLQLAADTRVMPLPATECLSLLHTAGGAVILNGSASTLIGLCDGDRTLEKVLLAFCGHYPDAIAIDERATVFLAHACRAHWLEIAE